MKNIAIALISLTLLQGCIVAAGAAIGVGAVSANDRRTIGSQVDDQTIEVKAHSLIAEDVELDEKTRIQIVSLNGFVLVVGQAPNTALKSKLINTISGIQGIKKIHNQIRIGKLSSIGTRTNDTWLTTKVKTELITSDKVDGTAIKVVTEDSEVFLMGLVKTTEGNIAVGIVRNIPGVSKVYKAFQEI